MPKRCRIGKIQYKGYICKKDEQLPYSIKRIGRGKLQKHKHVEKGQTAYFESICFSICICNGRAVP
jgi:hypothetical protein